MREQDSKYETDSFKKVATKFMLIKISAKAGIKSWRDFRGSHSKRVYKNIPGCHGREASRLPN